MMENLQKEYERIEKCVRAVDVRNYDICQCKIAAIMDHSPDLFMAIFLAFNLGFAKICPRTHI